VRTRVDKLGFPVPQGKWISGAWHDVIRELLDSQGMRERGIYNLPAIRKDLDLHRREKKNVSGKLFAVVQFELWSRRQKAFLEQPANADRGHLAPVSQG
jgi:asparagine synthase (glutamine-hydrolysing)